LGFFHQGLNDAGQVAFWASLADGTRGIFRADPVACGVAATAGPGEPVPATDSGTGGPFPADFVRALPGATAGVADTGALPDIRLRDAGQADRWGGALPPHHQAWASPPGQPARRAESGLVRRSVSVGRPAADLLFAALGGEGPETQLPRRPPAPIPGLPPG
jgi:hypothetical protein